MKNYKSKKIVTRWITFPDPFRNLLSKNFELVIEIEFNSIFKDSILSEVNCIFANFRFPILSQTDWLPGSKVFVEEKLTEFAIQWKFQDDLKCMESLKAEFWTHPYAPIHFLPPSDQLLSPITKQHTKSCSRKVENLRVILCLNRKSADDRRNAIRQTFANFSRFNLKSNWTIIFLVSACYDK